MKAPESIPYPLSIGLRDTGRSRELAVQICEFENSVFGPDFACPPETLRAWFASGCLFCAAVCGEAVAGRPRILSVTSVLLTSETARDQLLRGERADTDLPPWSEGGDGSRPVLYFASVISDNPGHLSSMYENLGNDIEAHLSRLNLEAGSAFAVASGEAGFRHMTRSGFLPAAASQYLGRYPVMTLDYASARTYFWQRVLQPTALRHRRGDALMVPTVEIVPASEPGLLEPDAHEVEKRLAMSKTERYRQMKSSPSSY